MKATNGQARRGAGAGTALVPCVLVSWALVSWALALIAVGCGPTDGPGPSGAPALREAIAVTSAPAAQLAAWVAPGATIEVLIPPGVRPRDWTPDDAALDALISARAVVTIGDAELEPWTQRVALPPSRTVAAAGDLREADILTVGTVKHTHGDGPAHAHGGTVATFWTDPALLPQLGAATAAGLRSAGFTDAAAPEGARAPWAADLAALEAATKALGDAAGGRALLASDHGLEYVARAAGITLRVALLECDSDGPTSPRGLAQLVEFSGESKDAGLLVVFSEVEARAVSAAAAEFGVQPHVFDLGLRYDPNADSLTRLSASINALAAELSKR